VDHDELAGELEAMNGLIVGLVRPDGSPIATRGWALRVEDRGRRVRLVLGSTVLAEAGHDDASVIGTQIAVTGADIATLQSAQAKGAVLAVDAIDDEDRRRVEQYCESYFQAVEEVDSVPRHLMERIVPSAFVACTFELAECYDQTPGPDAGRAIEIVPG